MKTLSDRQWTFLTAASLCVGVVLAWLMVPSFTYSRWDNFEYFVPTLMEAHGQWLKGMIPFWNPYQHMGEPLLANAQPGVLYFPYTVSVALVKLFNLDPRHLTFILVLIHLVWGGVGLFRLMRNLGVRPEIAWITAISACTGGFVSVMSTVWIFMPLVFSWLPWISLGGMIVFDPRKFSREIFWVPIGLAQVAFIGYPQLLCYSFLFFLILTVSMVYVHGYRKGTLLKFGSLLILSFLLMAPFLLPVMELVLRTSRSHEVGMAFFLERSVNPQSLLSLFLPLFDIDNGYLKTNGSFSFFQGIWVVPVLVGTLVWIARKGGREEAKDRLVRQGVVFFGIAVIFSLLSLGEFGGIYPLTHGIILWSNFRWPFKFLLFANLSLAISGGLALELWMRLSGRDRGKAVPIYTVLAFSILIGILLWLNRGSNFNSLPGLLVLFPGLLSLWVLPFLERGKIKEIFLFFLFIASVGNIGLAHSAGLKTYSERIGQFGPRQLGVNPEFRVLPMTPSEPQDPFFPLMQPLGLFQSATANQYSSITGGTTSMAPNRFLKWIPTSVEGILPRQLYPLLLKSNLLKSWNVRYFIAGKWDKWGLELLRDCKFHLAGEMEASQIFEREGALPRAYFATHVYPYEKENFFKVMLQNEGPVRAAFLPGKIESSILPPARVLRNLWKENSVRFEVEAPEGGLLVVTMAYFPEWEVFVDGKKEKLLNVNEIVQGVWVPEGAKIIEFRYRSTAFEAGLALFLCGLVAFWVLVRSKFFKRVK